jgi:predicted nuclease with TOPRIM domain
MPEKRATAKGASALTRLEDLVPRVRERIDELRAENARLRSRLEELEGASEGEELWQRDRAEVAERLEGLLKGFEDLLVAAEG